MTECVVCFSEKKDEYLAIHYQHHELSEILRVWKVCPKHKEELEKQMMSCAVCQNQDTKYVTGISKTGKNAGKPWAAWECTNPSCVNEKGFRNRTFVPSGPVRNAPVSPQANGVTLETLNKKLDLIIKCLGVKETVNVKDEESTPF